MSYSFWPHGLQHARPPCPSPAPSLSINLEFHSSVQLLNSVQFLMTDSFWSHGLQHARPPCPSPAPRVYSNSCPLSRWCHPTISSSVVPLSSRLQSFPASGLFKWVSSFKDCWEPAEARKRQRRILPWSLWGKPGPANTLFVDFSLQNHEKLNVCYFRSPCL